MVIAWLASAEARPRKEVVAPVAATPIPPAPGDDDGAALALPPLAGPTEIPNLQGLARDTASYVLEVDLSSLAELDGRQVDGLFTLLAADADWRVGRDEAGGRVATLRAEGQGPRGWTLSKERCSALTVREHPDPRWAEGANVVAVDAGAQPIRVRAFRPTGGTCSTFATALRIRGAVEVDVFEASAADARPFTLDGLERLARAAGTARPLAATLVASGHDPLGELPAAAGSEVVSPGPGLLTIRGAVDPGGPAWVWARVLDASGAPFTERTLAAATLERPGWSSRGDLPFPVASTVRVPGGAAFDGTLEWWALPDAGEPRRLASAKVTIPAR